jgi:DNA-binding NarL/FixJ family response regulator
VTKTADVHLFLCARGQTLPRWREAFATAKAAKLSAAGLDKVAARTQLVWLQMDRGATLPEQLTRIPGALRRLPLVVLSDLPADEEALEAFASGARGYCNSHAVPAVLQQVAGVVLQGGLWIGESLMHRLIGATSRVPLPEAARQDEPFEWVSGLTDRERQVAEAVSRGASNKEIARTLGITERTVKAHVGAVLEKLQVRDRLQLSLVVNGRSATPLAKLI